MPVEYNQELKVELIEKEILSIELKTIDIIDNTRQFTESLEAHIVINETPTKLTATTFQTTNNYIAESIVVYYNGLKHKAINKLSDNTFSFDFDTITDDTVEINYIKQP